MSVNNGNIPHIGSGQYLGVRSAGGARRGKGTLYGSSPGRRWHSNMMTGITVLGVLLLILLNFQKWESARVNGGSAGGVVGSSRGGGTAEGGSYSYFSSHDGRGGVDENVYSNSTLVLYVYNAEDEEQERSFAYFLRYGITENQPTYRIIVTDGPQVKPFPRLPSLPSNAQYLKTSLCTTTWGAIDAVSRVLNVQEYDYFVVIDSHVRGPFIPSYVSNMHWTEVFTRKLVDNVKMVGSVISCEGAPKDGNAAGEWRGNPYVKSHAWATDAEGFARLMAQKGVFRCHKNKWDNRYHSDAGAALTIFRSGWTIDSLMSRYQGVDWRSPATWQCNQRVPPDYENHYDGISISPYEVVFVPVKAASVASQWSFVEQADRYEKWLDLHLRQGEVDKEIQTNAWIIKHWQYKHPKLVLMNARGPECFDFDYYIENNPDLEKFKNDEMGLWEHFILIGQFQAKLYRFTCPMQVGNSYRIAYVLSRGPRCFDHEYYADQHGDLDRAGFDTRESLFEHFAEFGQFEKRKVRFTCADTMMELPLGFDNKEDSGTDSIKVSKRSSKVDPKEIEVRKAAIQRAALLRQRGDASDEVTQALKGALVEEAAKDMMRLKSRNKIGK